MNDYFTIEEFRRFAGEKSGAKYSEDQIVEGQEEVLGSLEAWARTAWPNVTARGLGSMTAADPTLTATTGTFAAADVGQAVRVVGAGTAGADLETTVLTYTDPTHVELAANAVTSVTSESFYVDGDGTAAGPRRITEELEYTNASKLFTSMVPILTVESFTTTSDAGVTDVLATNYRVLERQGIIRIAAPVLRGTWGEYEVTYTYGHLACPREVKRPAMQATLALLKDDAPGRVPGNVTQMTTEATTFLYGTAGTQLAGPWPWAPDASEALRSFWGRDRPRRAGAA